MSPRGETPKVRTPRLSQARALHILGEVADALNRAPDEQRVLSDALARVAELLGVATGWVWLRDPISGQFYHAASQHLPPYLQEPVRMTGRSCWCLDQFKRGQLTASNIDVVGCSRLAKAGRGDGVRDTRGLRCHASIPLSAGDRPLGVMNLAMRDWRRLTPQELSLLTTIADQVSVALERARLARQGIELARAEERTRLGRELHDTLAQGLTAVALQIEAGLAHVPSRGRARPPLARALDVARDTLDQARQTVRTLRTPLNDRSLADALADLSRRVTADTGIRIRPDVRLVEALSPELEAELFRIAGEALANVTRHARARTVDLGLTLSRGRVRLTVADDGIGFRTRGARERGFGLAGMEERAHLLGGRLLIRSAPGQGTTIVASVPRRRDPTAGGASR